MRDFLIGLVRWFFRVNSEKQGAHFGVAEGKRGKEEERKRGREEERKRGREEERKSGREERRGSGEEFRVLFGSTERVAVLSMTAPEYVQHLIDVVTGQQPVLPKATWELWSISECQISHGLSNSTSR